MVASAFQSAQPRPRVQVASSAESRFLYIFRLWPEKKVQAIAVSQAIGAGWWIHRSLFDPGDTLAARIAEQFQGAQTNLQTSSLFYLAAILLVIGLVTNLAAQVIVRRFEFQRTGAD